MAIEQFASLDGKNSVQMHFLSKPDPEFYEWLAKLFLFKAERMREAAAQPAAREE